MGVQRAWLRDREALAQLVSYSGLSERELARRAMLGHSTVTHLLSGQRKSCSVQTAQTIAGVLGVEVHKLFVT